MTDVADTAGAPGTAGAPDGADVLTATGVSKRFDGIAALVDVSVRLAPGELVALIGPNGAGKSTLFAGLSVRDHLLVADRAQRTGGGLFRDLFGRSSASAAEKEHCDEVLELVGLTKVAELPAAALTLGTGRLVELARALTCRPDLLFLDEPSSGLDHRETDEMGTVLEHVREVSGTTILLCEHDVAFVQRLASRAYVLDCGKLIAEGPIDAVLEQADVRTAYLGAEA